MRHEFTRRWITLGSALALGLASATSSLRAEDASAEPKQKALITFKMDFFSRFKKDEPAPEQPATMPTATMPPVEPTSEVVPVNALEPLPAGTAKTHAVPASNPPGTGQNPAAQPLATAAAQGQYPSVLPPSVPPVQLASGQFPLPPAGQMPFQTAQSPVVVMMPAGWQPDGNYSFAPRTVLSPEVPAEHWPTSQRNPLGDSSRKGLFDWPQIARKITNSTVGEPDPRPEPAEAQPTSSRALFAAAPAQPQVMPAQPQLMPAQQQGMQPQMMPAGLQTVAAPVMPAQPQAMPHQPQTALFPATTPQAAAVATAPTVEAQPTSKALFAPQPKQPEPQVEESKSRALLSLLSKPMKKPASAQPSTGTRALFALGSKPAEPAAAPAPAVVPQYSVETPLPPDHSMQLVPPANTVEPSDPEVQPPAPPTVAHPLPGNSPGKFETVKSDNPKMKWRSKGASEPVVERAAVTTDVSQHALPTAAAMPAGELSNTAVPATPAAVLEESLMEEPLVEEQPQPARSVPAMHRHVQHQPVRPAADEAPVSHERSLFGKHFASAATQTPRNANDRRGPWRRQAERDAAEAAEKQIEQPIADSKAILPNVAAMFPVPEKPSRPQHTHDSAPSNHRVTTVAATQDATAPSHPVRQAHDTSARSSNSYYADPWEKELEAELSAIEKRQIGAVSNRRAAVSRQTSESDAEPSKRPRVPFEADELEQEKALQRRTAKTAKPAESLATRSSAPAGSPSNGARMAEQKSKKSYRRLTADDWKQGVTRPLEIFNDMTRLPGSLKSAADHVDRHPEQMQVADNRDQDVELEVDSDRPSAAKRPRVQELRQTTAAAASTKKFADRELLTRDDETSSAANAQRGGRRQVQRSATPSRMAEKPAADLDAAEVVIADDSAEEEVDVKVEQTARPAVQIRNKHGNRVKIFTGDAATADSSGDE